MALVGDILARIGGDNSDLRSVLADSENRVSKAFRAMAGSAGESAMQMEGVSRSISRIRNLFLLGGLLASVKGFFSSAIEYAREYKGAIDEDVEATKRFSGALDQLKVTGAKMVVEVIGLVDKAAFGLASLVYGVDAASDAYSEMDAAARKALDDDRTNKLTAAKEQLAKINRDIAFAEADNIGKVNILLNEQIKIRERIKAAGDETVAQQEALGELAKNEAEIRKFMAAISNGEAQTEKTKTASLQDQQPARKQLADDAEREAAAATRSAQAAKQTYEAALKRLEVQRQIDVQEGKHALAAESMLIVNGKAYGPSRNPQLFEQASSAELRELVRRLQLEISAIERGKGLGPTALAGAATNFLIEESVIGRLRTDIQRAQFQLVQRERLAINLSRLGESEARRRFEGDPLAYDELVRSQGAMDEQTMILREIRDQQRHGIKAVVVNTFDTRPVGG
ncbi:MAG: hypothetical protein ACOZE5_08045 [Verrucomicrobiota bacterium]